MQDIVPDLPTRSALILVDVQQGFDDPSWGPRNNPDAESKIAELLAAWREAGWPVIHIVHDSLLPTSPLNPRMSGNAPKTEAQPHASEPTYRKSVNSAFIGTPLEADLRSAEISTLVLVGLTTNHCVSTTTRMAGNLGFLTYVVSDATATFDRVGINGRNRRAEDVHAAALSDLHGEFATVVDTATILKALYAIRHKSFVEIAR